MYGKRQSIQVGFELQTPWLQGMLINSATLFGGMRSKWSQTFTGSEASVSFMLHFPAFILHFLPYFEFKFYPFISRAGMVQLRQV